MPERKDWEILGEPLGTGGQSTVYKVRNPTRASKRSQSLRTIRAMLAPRTTFELEQGRELADAISEYSRPDHPNELGALKVFDKVRREGAPAEERLQREIEVLKQGRPGLPTLLDSNEAEKWIVTEFFPEGTLEQHNLRFAGKPGSALRAFKTLLKTVAALHKEKIVHRDIKPANVFIGNDGLLVLGDFGIVFLGDQAARMTRTEERVGPWDYMPQWADTGDRLDTVEPNFDVYMLGKLLWCMLSGRLRLPREYHRRPQYDLTKMFSNIKEMHLVNSLLDKCLCEEAGSCLSSAQDLLGLVEEALEKMESALPPVSDKGKLKLKCLACGRGVYQPIVPSARYGSLRFHQYDEQVREVGIIAVRAFCCDVCTHYAFFAAGYPDDAAPKLLAKP